ANPEFIALGKLVAADLEKLMTPPSLGESTKPAVWSRGIEISQLIHSKGYQTLESTLYGCILDEMTNPTYRIWLGSNKWGPQGALWNCISAEYVKATAISHNTMHVFMRTHDLNSIFYREEMINWRAAKNKCPGEEDGLTYHTIVGINSFKTHQVFK